MKFSQIEYERPNTEHMLKQLTSAVKDFESAKSGEEQFEIYDKVEQIFDDFATPYAIARIRYMLDTNDEFYSGEQVYLVKEYGKMIEKFKELSIILLKSPYLGIVQEKIGAMTVKNIEIMIKQTSSETKRLIEEEQSLVRDYVRLINSLTVEFDGKEMPLSMLASYKESTDRAQRKAALTAEGDCYNRVKVQLDEIFSSLVKTRVQQAKLLGFDSFSQLSYARMKRNCYTREEVTLFKKEVVQNIVPVVSKIRQNRFKRLGIDNTMYYDLPISFKDGSPKPIQDSKEILNAAKRMYSEMSPKTDEVMSLIIDKELYDVLPRVGKMPTGMCSHLVNYNYPFVVANFNGTSTDVYVLTHEIGHAVAKYYLHKGGRKQYATISSDVSEAYAMAMEFLATPWYELFFKEQAQKYELSHAEDALILIPYACQVDDFQEYVYKNPDITPRQRDEKWLELEKIYRPSISASGVPFYENGAGWQRQAHIYKTPFYYIDYALAQVVALQFFAIFLDDKNTAIEKYFDFIEKSKGNNFVDLLKATKLSSPFCEGALKNTADNVYKHIENLSEKIVFN